MIIDFSISNFRSIREMQTLSFEASNDRHLEDYFVVKVGRYRLLKIATILGANASGKSNVLRAFYMLEKLLTRPCKDKSSKIEYDRFALDRDCLQSPSLIRVNFIVGEVKYMYEVEFDNSVIYRELLKCHPFDALKEHTVYERTTNKDSLLSSIKWGERYRSGLNTRVLSVNLLHNRTLFGAYLNSNVDIPWMKAILDWVCSYFMPMVTTNNQRLRDYVSYGVLDNRIDKRDLVSQIMKADVGISNIDVEKVEGVRENEIVDAVLKNVPEVLKQHIKADLDRPVIDIRMSHAGHQEAVKLDYYQESGGTQRYYELSGLLLEVIKEPHFLAIDELECRLHPDLYKHFVMTYVLNAKKSQLIVSSHMREFLEDRDSFRDDTVWITEKSEMGDTELYSLSDFDSNALRSVSSRYNAYRAGRLGGIPRLGDTYVQLSNVSEE